MVEYKNLSKKRPIDMGCGSECRMETKAKPREAERCVGEAGRSKGREGGKGGGKNGGGHRRQGWVSPSLQIPPSARVPMASCS